MAERDELLSSLHKAIEAEVNGYHFYLMAARATSDEQGRRVFEQLAAEELQHIRFLKEQHTALTDRGAVDPSIDLGALPHPEPHPIFSAALRGRIQDAHYEMSALSIGVQLELSSISYYQQQARTVSDPTLRAFFEKLAHWESGHYQSLLQELDSLKESYWAEGGFTPF